MDQSIETNGTSDKEQMFAALRVLENAMEHESNMLKEQSNCRTEYETNKLVMGPEYWVLYENMRKAEAACEAAKQAVIEATKILDDLEVEYYKNLKCTFCGELDSICDGDHGDEMRDICREGR